MTAVTNIDQLVILLRQRLREREGRAKTSSSKEKPSSAADPTFAARALAASGEADERQFRRALVQSLLAEGLGRRLMNEARFQNVVDQVLEALEADPNATDLVQRVSRDLRAVAKRE